MSVVDRFKAQLVANLQCAEHMRQAILAGAFSGQLSTQAKIGTIPLFEDNNDE